MAIIDKAVEKIKDRIDQACDNGRVPESERLLSVIAGGFIVAYSVRSVVKSPLTALSGLTLGGALLVRGVTGKCAIKGAISAQEEELTHTVVEHRYFVK
ncbi:MAG: YgaP family membrane protein [Sphingobacterium sp.]|uniref:YgaP family membrane protein n=1 Tax=Sphingobacterium sp. JB170 TaxID=1434842 RepID=UPI00097EA2CE|nr:DUF2892 domain-containing protein [Sphingobacterium sp. JB170]SJN36125.1 hypothetical protein FM107_08725 [Sphingobacterium sp. JB170]